MREDSKMEKDLSNSEKPIMKIIWCAEGDIALLELIEQLRVQFGKDYARTTVTTFLKKLSDKGYVRTYVKGNNSYVHPLISMESYRREVMRRDSEFWFGGNFSDALASMLWKRKVSGEEIRKMKEMLDDLED